MRIKLIFVLAGLILGVLTVQLSGPRVATQAANTAYQFVEIETTLHRADVETSSENSEERRWYISSVIVQPEDVPTYSLVKHKPNLIYRDKEQPNYEK